MKTQEEILKRIDEVAKYDTFGWQRNDLVDFLNFENAKPFLKDDITAEKWEEVKEKRSPKEIMCDYMGFAWEKANDKRGISACRSLEHYKSWLWLDGDEEIWPTLDDYEYYGKPHLITICEYLGLDPSNWDDGVRENS